MVMFTKLKYYIFGCIGMAIAIACFVQWPIHFIVVGVQIVALVMMLGMVAFFNWMFG